MCAYDPRVSQREWEDKSVPVGRSLESYGVGRFQCGGAEISASIQLFQPLYSFFIPGTVQSSTGSFFTGISGYTH